MTELERWMNDHPPLSEPLTAEETAALRQKVLARRPKPHLWRGWRLAVAAAALCLVAAGAVVLGFFHPMSAANETNALVQKYGVVLEEPLTVQVGSQTLTIRALLRSNRTVRILYDLDGGGAPDDITWCSGQVEWDGDNLVLYGSGIWHGRRVGAWDDRYEPAENGETLHCYVDCYFRDGVIAPKTTFTLVTENDHSVMEKFQLPIPERIGTVQVKTNAKLPMTSVSVHDYNNDTYYDSGSTTVTVKRVTVSALQVTAAVTISNGDPYTLYAYTKDLYEKIRLFDKEGQEIAYGWEGHFYSGGMTSWPEHPDARTVFTMELDSYDIIDPEAVAYVEIDGERFEVKG
ncbi:hypothetical protein [Gemmiger sp.]